MPNPFDIKEIPDCLLKPCNKKYPSTFEEFEDEAINIMEKYRLQPAGRNEIAGLINELNILKDMAKSVDIDIRRLFPVTCATGNGFEEYTFHINGEIYIRWYDTDDAKWYTKEYKL